MMGFGTKRLNKTLFVEPNGAIRIKGNPYEKSVEFSI